MRQKPKLNYHETYDRLLECLTSKKIANKWFHSGNRKYNVAILLIQLRNGSRISEAIEAYNTFSIDGIREVLVRTRKRGYKFAFVDGKKKRASQDHTPETPHYRKMLIPEEVERCDIDYEPTVYGLSRFCKSTFGFCTHDLRYCYIGFMSNKGYPAQIIARTTGQKTLNMVLDYTLDQLGDEALKQVLDGKIQQPARRTIKEN